MIADNLLIKLMIQQLENRIIIHKYFIKLCSTHVTTKHIRSSFMLYDLKINWKLKKN